MGKEYTLGKMEESMRGNINMTKNMDMEYIFGLMEEVKFMIYN